MSAASHRGRRPTTNGRYDSPAITFDRVCCAFMRDALERRAIIAPAASHGRELWLTDDDGLFEVARIAYCPWCASNVAWLLPAPPMTTEGAC
jgi:hypothetical protein